MSRRRRTYPTRYRIGRYRLVTIARRRGYAIVDEAGDIAYTTPHPNTGRPIPALEPDARRALRIAQSIDELAP